jgi:hypothetical protein
MNTLKKSTFHSVDSPLTEEDIVMFGNHSTALNEELAAELNDEDNEEDLDETKYKTSSESSSKKSAGRPFGSTMQNKKAKAELIAQCITKAAVALDKAHASRSVMNPCAKDYRTTH